MSVSGSRRRVTIPVPTARTALAALVGAAAATVLMAAAARAEPFQMTISGNFYTAPSIACFFPSFSALCNTQPASISQVVGGTTVSSMPIANGTAFTETARFDTSSPNLGAAIPGTAFYSPSSVTLSVGGITYQMAPYSAAVPNGVAVSIFDLTSPFPAVPEYGVALIGNPLRDGAGILADFTTASPNFTVGNLTSTTFSGYVGTGIFSGTCLSNCGVPSPPNQIDNVEPIPMTSGGQDYTLTLPDAVILNYALALDDLNTPPFGTTITTPFTASILDVPEPASLSMLGIGVLALAMITRARRA